MHVKHVHEHADLEGATIEPGVIGFGDNDDATVGRRDHAIWPTGKDARRITEKLNDKQCDRPEQPGQTTAENRGQNGRTHGQTDEGPAFFGEQWMRIVHGHSFVRC